MMSARSFGNYDLPSALADLVDNSLKARARTLHVSRFRYDAGVEVRIRDDGEGMSVNALASRRKRKNYVCIELR
ncbi:hypothetical protein EAH79_09285 [Sphingomonas koreensis]|nr:hypothetical protein EAH79_09285 [Sphingomonas koreensis]